MPYYSFRTIPLDVLIADADAANSARLERELRSRDEIRSVVVASSVENSWQVLGRSNGRSNINIIFVDPLSLSLDEATDFVFQTRESSPEIKFCLYVNQDSVEENRQLFYHGRRSRFGHYYNLDKRLSDEAMAEELKTLVRDMQNLIAFTQSRAEAQRLIVEAEQARASSGHGATVQLAEDLRHLLDDLKDTSRKKGSTVQPNSVFLSHRFAEKDYVTGLSTLLEEKGFTVVIGSPTNTYISQAILERIRESEFFIALMTRASKKADGTYTTSPWLLEEKGAALAYGKRIVLMVEDGVSDFGELQGDWQRIHFKPKSFLTAALNAVKQLASYSGSGQD